MKLYKQKNHYFITQLLKTLGEMNTFHEGQIYLIIILKF